MLKYILLIFLAYMVAIWFAYDPDVEDQSDEDSSEGDHSKKA